LDYPEPVLLHQLVGEELRWIPTSLVKDHYDLVWHQSVLGHFEMSNWSSNATAVSAHGRLELRRQGFWRSRLLVFDAESSRELAVFERGWGESGRVRYADGRTLKWQKRSFWRSERAWTDMDGQTLVRFQTGLSRTVSVTIDPLGAACPEIWLLVALGLEAIILTRRFTEAAAIGAAVAAG
jgi:hypothetical protein